MRTLWILLDPADGDPATFFYYLREAAASLSPARRSRLPLFTPEYRDDPRGFGRRFFRGLFDSLGREAVVVLDNYHELASDSSLHGVLAACVDEVPEGNSVIVISRTESPAEFARAFMNGRIAKIDWDDLRLVPAETEAIALARGISESEHLEVLHSRSGGWLAGVVLLSEQWRKTGSVQVVEESDTMQTVFDYFAGEILDSVPVVLQDVLLRTSLLPRVTRATAAAVCDVHNAIDHVERLHRRRLFVDRVQGPVATYRYHALFRAFLEARLAVRLPDAERKLLLRRAADAFEAEGGVEDAFALYVEGMDILSAERLFVAHAPRLIAQGRWRALGDWHLSLSARTPTMSPWVTFWLGRSLATVQPHVAWRILESSHAGFISCSDLRGQILASAGILEALYYQYDHFREMDTWIDRIEVLLRDRTIFETGDEALWVHSAFMLACTYRSPNHALLRTSVAAVERLIEEATDVNARVSVATMLHYYGYAALDERANRLAAKVARPLLADAALTVRRAAMYLAEEGYAHYAFLRYREALDCFDTALAIARQHGLSEVEEWVLHTRGFCQRRIGDFEAATGTVQQIEQSILNGTGFGAALRDLLRAYVEFGRGLVEPAISRSTAALAICDAAGQKRTQVLALTIHAGMLIEVSRGDEAASVLDAAAQLSEGTVLEHLRGAISLMRAFAALRTGDRAASEHRVAEMIGWSRFERERIGILWYRPILEQVLGLACDEGLCEEPFIRLAHEAGLKPVYGMSDQWPWAVKVYTLGRFEVLVGGKRLEYGRKAPKRVIELLKLLIASGGEAVEERLMDVLWPDLDGDAAHKALGALLHRLRRLLGSAAVVRQQGGRLWLERELCWTDVGYFERALAARNDGGAPPAVLAAYRGVFLPDDDGLPWVLPVRQRARRLYVERVRQQAAYFQVAGDLASASQCLLHAVQVDGSESLRQELARCWERLGRTADAEALTDQQFLSSPATACASRSDESPGGRTDSDELLHAVPLRQTVSNL
ncbi:MAG: hypothetical protein JNL33_08420 [Betaproteobacteria bacterium]|nr:hypothetical protein [Betaproteobacteria bacterium]